MISLKNSQKPIIEEHKIILADLLKQKKIEIQHQSENLI